MGLSHVELARQMGTTKETLINLEAGRYAKPPEWIIAWWTTRGSDYLSLTDGYEKFVADTRHQSHRFLGNPPYEFWTKPYFGERATHPFTKWRMLHGLSIQDVTKHLCISKDSLRYFEQKSGRNQKSVPKALIAALKDCGYTVSELDNLRTAYAAYLEVLADGGPIDDA